MHQHVGHCQRRVDEVRTLVEVLVEFEVGVVDGWDLQEVGNDVRIGGVVRLERASQHRADTADWVRA